MSISRKTSSGPVVFSTRKKKNAGAAIGAVVVGHRVPVKRGANALDARKKRALATQQRRGSR